MRKSFLAFFFFSLIVLLSISFFASIIYLLEAKVVLGVVVSVLFLLTTYMVVSDKEFIKDIEE